MGKNQQCDFCGNFFTGPGYPTYDENFERETAMQCPECFGNAMSEPEEDANQEEIEMIDKTQKEQLLTIKLSQIVKTDLQSQIEFMEYISSNSINLPLPIFKSIINSLKELQSIKHKTNDEKEYINLGIPKEDIEEVIHLLRYSINEQRVSNDTWVLLMNFCEDNSSLKFDGNEEKFITYAKDNDNTIIK